MAIQPEVAGHTPRGCLPCCKPVLHVVASLPHVAPLGGDWAVDQMLGCNRRTSWTGGESLCSGRQAAELSHTRCPLQERSAKRQTLNLNRSLTKESLSHTLGSFTVALLFSPDQLQSGASLRAAAVRASIDGLCCLPPSLNVSLLDQCSSLMLSMATFNCILSKVLGSCSSVSTLLLELNIS